MVYHDGSPPEEEKTTDSETGRIDVQPENETIEPVVVAVDLVVHYQDGGGDA